MGNAAATPNTGLVMVGERGEGEGERGRNTQPTVLGIMRERGRTRNPLFNEPEIKRGHAAARSNGELRMNKWQDIKSFLTASISGGGADREPALSEFYTRAGSAKIAPESPPSASRRVGRVLLDDLFLISLSSHARRRAHSLKYRFPGIA